MSMTPERYNKIKLSNRKDLNTKSLFITKDYGFETFGFGTDTNTTISATQAMAIETVYTCVRDKAETCGRLPVHLYDNTDPKKTFRVLGGRLHRIFTQQPCSFMTMQGFMEFMVASYELYGAFYAYPAYNDRGAIMELIPFVNQQNVKPAMDVNGQVYWSYVTNDGKIRMSFGINDLFIVNQFTLNGYTPVSTIQYNATFLNGTSEAEKTWNELQENGITSQFALSTDKAVNPESAKELRKDWKESRGAPGVNNIPVLEDGMKITSLKLAPKDAELLQTREFSVNRICRMFRVPPERIGVPKSASQSQTLLDIDEFYMRNGIEPILLKYEASFNILLRELGVKKFIRVNRKAFYNGSPHRMIESVSAELKVGGCTVNEMRIDLGRDPVEGGDVFVIDSNNLTFGTWDQLPSMEEQRLASQPAKPTNDGGKEDEQA